MYKIITGLALISLSGCVPDMSTKVVKKLIERDKGIVEWSAYGSAYMDAPDLITLQVGETMDTICQSQNIRNVDVLDKEVVVISFNGQPKLHTRTIQLPEKVLGFRIVIIDTSYNALFP